MSGIGTMGKQALRVAKNYTKGYSDTQTKVREATSNDPWGPSGTQMNEIATLTFNQQDFIEIMELMDKRLNDKGKNWRHVFKTLTLLDYLLHAGSENVVLYFRENLYVIKTLKEFQYLDDYGKDQGANVRQKAKDISNLLMDEARLRDERRSRAHMRDRMSGRRTNSLDEEPRRPKSVPARQQSRGNGEDEDLQKALELSRLSAAEEEERARRKAAGDAEMEEAMRLSREEARRRAQIPDPIEEALFDDGYEQHNNNQFQLIDTSIPYQQTGFQPQFSSFNPYAQQQQAEQEEYMRQQQMMEMQRQEMERQQQQAQYDAMMQQAYLQQQQLMAQPTATPIQPQMTSYGSNNPFAQFASSTPGQSTTPTPQRAPSAPSSSFNFSDYGSLSTPSTSTGTPPPLPPQTTSNAEAFRKPPKKDDGQHARLAQLLAQGTGIDTFGNEGNLRVPAGQAFHASNRLASQQTGMSSQQTGANGRNPFGQSQPARQQQQPSDQPFFSI